MPTSDPLGNVADIVERRLARRQADYRQAALDAFGVTEAEVGQIVQLDAQSKYSLSAVQSESELHAYIRERLVERINAITFCPKCAVSCMVVESAFVNEGSPDVMWCPVCGHRKPYPKD